jgi:AraC-like DNA-binding protein
VVGDHFEEIEDLELVLVGPNLQHGWFTHRCKSKKITEVTIQFHRDLFDTKFLQRNQMSFIKNMFERSLKGILFSKQTTKKLMPRLLGLTSKKGFETVLEMMSIFHELSTSEKMRTLSDAKYVGTESITYPNWRIELIMRHLGDHFDKPITLAEIGKLVSMSEVGLSRFFKMNTGKTITDALTEIRIGHASRRLIESMDDVAEIAYACGFNNISNFNRIFKKKKSCTPKEFRLAYNASGVRTFI